MAISARLLGKKIGTINNALLKEVYEMGFTMKEIAQQLGCSETVVRSRLTRTNTHMRGPSDYANPPKQKVNINDRSMDVPLSSWSKKK